MRIRMSHPRQCAVILLLILVLAGCSAPVAPDDGTVSENADISVNTVWEADRVHIVEGSIDIIGAVLTIEPGTEVRFSQGAALVVGTGGGLIADGTDSIITFTGTEQRAGWWQYIRFNENAVDDSCRLTRCRIEYAGGAGDGFGAVHAYFASPSLSGCVIRHSGSYGAYFYKDHPALFSGNTITGCTGAPVRIGFSGVAAVDTGTYTGNGRNIIEVSGGTLSEDAVWQRQDVPYLLHYGEIRNAVLTLAPGCEIRMAADGDLKISDGGGLIADGTDGQITITGDIQQKGSWRYIYFDATAADTSCRLTNCAISYGGGFNSTYGMVYAYYCSPSVDSCHISNSASFGVQFNDCLPGSFTGNRITDCVREPVAVPFNGVPLIDSCDYTGNTCDYIRVTPAILQEDAVWIRHAVPYLVENGTIRNGTLTLQPSVRLYMDTTASITVSAGGGLIADGTESTIMITGLKQTPGYWKYIRFNDDAAAANCRISHCDISYGGGDPSTDGILYCFGISPAITSSVISSSATWGIVYYGTSDTQTENTFSDNAFGDVKVQ